MKYGVWLLNLGPQATTENVFAIADKAEALGFDSVWTADHLIHPAELRSVYPYPGRQLSSIQHSAPMLDAFAVLCAVAGRTRRVQLGTSVLILPYRHPLLTAKLAATLDALSGGRVLLGVGVGWMEEEFRVLGAPPYQHRGAVTDEQLAILKLAWTEATPSFQGRFYQFDKIEVYPKPVQKPHIPLLIGGNTRMAMRRAAYNDGWHPTNLQPSQLEAHLQQLKSICGEVGRPYDTLHLSLRQRFILGEQDDPNSALVGPPRKLVESLKQYEALGIQHILFSVRGKDTQDVLCQMERFADEVRPRVR